ncbi:MAG: hypothetical protein ACLR4Z_07365 [Butyricicoccaceae bacterium]
MQKVMEIRRIPGPGVRARIHNRTILVGNRKLMISRGVKGVPELRAQSSMWHMKELCRCDPDGGYSPR